MNPSRRLEVETLSAYEAENLVRAAVRDEFAELREEMAALRSLVAAQGGFAGKEVLAGLLGVRPRTLEKWTREHGLPRRRVGRVPLYIVSEVLEWVEAQGNDFNVGDDPR